MIPAQTRWRRLPEERPAQIIEAALAIFGERGLAAARLEDIAKRAGLSKGTIYLYFPNKEELFREVVRRTVIPKLEQREQTYLTATGSAIEVLDSFMRTFWISIRSSGFAPMFRLVHAEIHNFPDLAAFYAEEVVSRSHKLITALIAKGVKSGEFRDVDPGVAARTLAATFVMHGLWCTHPEHFAGVASKTDEQVLDELIAFIHQALLPGDQATSPAKRKGRS